MTQRVTAIVGLISLLAVGLWLLVWLTPDWQLSGDEPAIAVILTVLTGVFAIRAVFTKADA